MYQLKIYKIDYIIYLKYNNIYIYIKMYIESKKVFIFNIESIISILILV